MAIHDNRDAESRDKDDGSPVTAADLVSDQIIRTQLSSQFPEDAVLTEEGQDELSRLSAPRCWIVDPLDGTRQFMTGSGIFDVLIALVINGRPVVGVIYHPPSDVVLLAVRGQGAWLDRGGRRETFRVGVRSADAPLRIASSIWYDVPAATPVLDRIATGLSPRPITLETNMRPMDFGADGDYDAFVGYVPSGYLLGGEWDFAAVDIVMHEAGGTFTDLWGRPHYYNKRTAKNIGGLLSTASPGDHTRLVAAVAPYLPGLPTTGAGSV